MDQKEPVLEDLVLGEPVLHDENAGGDKGCHSSTDKSHGSSNGGGSNGSSQPQDEANENRDVAGAGWGRPGRDMPF